VYESELKDVHVNEPIRQDLALEFPEGAIVVDQRLPAYYLWGKGKPARTFSSGDEFNAWIRGRQLRLQTKKTMYRPWPLGTLAAAVVTGGALLGLILYRRRIAGQIARTT
jgi:hypothetical protein